MQGSSAISGKTTNQLSGSSRCLFLLYPNGKRFLVLGCFLFAADAFGGSSRAARWTDTDHPRYDFKMKPSFLVETVFLAGVVLLSQATAKVRPKASGISRTGDGGLISNMTHSLKRYTHCTCLMEKSTFQSSFKLLSMCLFERSTTSFAFITLSCPLTRLVFTT